MRKDVAVNVELELQRKLNQFLYSPNYCKTHHFKCTNNGLTQNVSIP